MVSTTGVVARDGDIRNHTRSATEAGARSASREGVIGLRQDLEYEVSECECCTARGGGRGGEQAGNGYLGDHQQVLEESHKSSADVATVAPDTSATAETFTSDAVAQVARREPAAAIAIADMLDEGGYVYFNGDEIRASAGQIRGDRITW